jgi:hypothetical protein
MSCLAIPRGEPESEKCTGTGDLPGEQYGKTGLLVEVHFPAAGA